jgi:predicted permease
MRPAVGVPRVARRLVERALPADVREGIAGDLEEEFAARVAATGPARARRWYWRHAIAIGARFLVERAIETRRSRRRARPRAARRGGVMGRSFSWLDLKLAVRMLIKFPGLTTVSVIAMAVAIAICVGFFEFTHDLSSRALPLPEGDRIVGLGLWNPATSEFERRSLGDYLVWRHELTTIEDLGAYTTAPRNLITSDGHVEPVAIAEISAAAFRVARVPPLLGRPLLESDEPPGATPVAVIGYGVWHARFGGDPGVIGRTVRLGAQTHTIVGVMPDGFAFPVSHSMWVPLHLPALGGRAGEGPSLRMFGRLASGVTLAEAQAQLATIGARPQALATPSTPPESVLQPRVMPYTATFLDEEVAIIWQLRVFQTFLVLILVVCCINVAALIFARTVTRAGEIAVRTALGASRARIVAQLFLESLTLSALAAVAGLAIADAALERLMTLMFSIPGNGSRPFWWDLSLSVESIVYVIGLALLAAIVAGVVPALKGTGRSAQASLQQVGTRSATLRFGLVWTLVIVVQVALSVAILPMAIEEGWDAVRAEAGSSVLPAAEYLSARIELDADAPTADAPARPGSARILPELSRRLMTTPGVAGVTFANRLPGMDHGSEPIDVENVTVTGRPRDRVRTASVALDFFDALNTPILAGRAFTAADLTAARPVVMVNQSFVRSVLGGRHALGQRVRFLNDEGEPGDWHDIVGVVPDLGMSMMRQADAKEAAGLYRPLALDRITRVIIAIHVHGDPASFAPQFRALVPAVDPTLRLYDVMPLDRVGRIGQSAIRMLGVALAAIAAVALLLSTVGIYSLMSFTVSQRTREIAIRVALGARPRRIVAAIFSRAFAQVGLGALAGVMILLLARTEESRNVLLLGAVALVMMTVGLAACSVPALRALRIQPTEALKDG